MPHVVADGEGERTEQQCEARDAAEEEREAPVSDDTHQHHRAEQEKVHQMFATLRPDDADAG